MSRIKKIFNNDKMIGKILRLFVVLILLTIICFVGYLVMKSTGLWQKINSMDKIRKVVGCGGVFSFLIFIIFQLLQTTILQVPSFFVTVAGALIFGRWPAFFMSYFAVMLGSIIMFIVGRRAGRKFLNWIIGKTMAENWIDKMSNGKYLFFLMMLFPMFPDDILCVVAGVTNMSFGFFFWTNVLARGLGVACTVFLGSGAIIPFKGWGLAVWAGIFVFIGLLFYLSVRFKDKIDSIFMTFSKKAK